MRSVVYRYDDLRQLADALEAASGQTLLAPRDSGVRDGEWVLAMFELARSARATAAAARGVQLDAGAALVFERRDWERLRQFATAPPQEASALHPNAQVAPSSQRVERVAPEEPDEPVPSETGEATVSMVPEGPPPRPAAQAPLRGRTAAYETARVPDVPVPSAALKTSPMALRPDGSLSPRAIPTPRATVLLVDDDPDLQEIVVAMLDAVGLEVDAVETAEEGLERLRSRRPDLLVLDWSLPGMSGLELCKRLRRDPAFGKLAILFLTAHAGTQDMVEAFAAGADDYVVKPFRAAELGARIFGLLRRSRLSGSREPAP